MGALDLARAFGIEEVELPEPPGYAAKIRPLGIDELLRSRTAPAELRLRVVEMAARDGGPKQAADADVAELGVEAIEWQAALMVKALRTAPDQPWESVTLTPEVFAELPVRTQAALRDIAEGKKTPAMVTALVRRMRGEITEDEAVAIFRAERGKLVTDWESFRHDRGGAGDRPDGADVGSQPKQLHARPRARRRARAG